ncbi:class I SAM-dependent methyltransferase [Ktedonobacteria bacterium brp13]|nr:class I SAM-dependent methyltransferase [Ktedonobacteria bacterium brp13]
MLQALPPVHWFINPFQIEDLLVFDQQTLQLILVQQRFGVTLHLLAQSCHHVSETLVQQIALCLSPVQQQQFWGEVRVPCTLHDAQRAQCTLLNALFWELIYWKMPERYEELTEGEALHPALFPSLEPLLRGKTVVDIGAGSGRATFGCVGVQAAHIYAIEPSPGLLQLLRQKITMEHVQDTITASQGCFEQLPLADASVDCSLACSAFTALEEQGGEVGLSEMKRVIKPGGHILILWPRTCDHTWFRDHGFHYVSFSQSPPMAIRFRSLSVALQCADLFYGNLPHVKAYLQTVQVPLLPFSLIGLNPPCDYFWLQV